MQTAIILAIVLLAAVYIGWRLRRTFSGEKPGCGCGSKQGCLKMMDAMDHAGRVKRKRHQTPSGHR